MNLRLDHYCGGRLSCHVSDLSASPATPVVQSKTHWSNLWISKARENPKWSSNSSKVQIFENYSILTSFLVAFPVQKEYSSDKKNRADVSLFSEIKSWVYLNRSGFGVSGHFYIVGDDLCHLHGAEILDGLRDVGSSRLHGNILVSVKVDARHLLVTAL